MTMKRMISLCLSLLLLTGAAFAGEAPISPAPSYEIKPVTDRTLVRVWGTAVEVEDTGRGLDEEEIPLVFQRFRRGEETQDQDGVGIGLYLAREILAGEGGYIRISSEKGRGSVFSVFLPNRIKENLSELS